MGRDGVWYERKRMKMEGPLLSAARVSARAVPVPLVQMAGCEEDEKD